MPKCPVCSTEYREQETSKCLTCEWDLTAYPLTFQLPEDFHKKEQEKLAWARKTWARLVAAEKHQPRQITHTQQNRIYQQAIPEKTIQQQTTPTSVQNLIEVYEFSRGFINLVFKNGKWISEGFASEIGISNCPVPPKIQDAVNRGEFRVNDNYPPKENDYALIAREVDEYSVLVVVTRLEDNKTRFLNAYRYFWLEKPSQNIDAQNIDGIGTLLFWWFNSKTPKFDAQWNYNSTNLNYLTKYYTYEQCYQSYEQYKLNFQQILPIRNYPEVFISPGNNAYSPLGLHYLALDTNQKHNTPISWAWNVNGLDNPAMFALICCADERGYQINLPNVNQQRKLLTPTQAAPSQRVKQVINSSGVNYEHNLTQKMSQPSYTSHTGGRQQPSTISLKETTNTPNEQELKLIKTYLSSININDEQRIKQKLTELAHSLIKYPNLFWRNNSWSNQVIENSRKNYNVSGGVTYIAMLAILGNIPIPEWLTQLKLQNNNNYEKDSFQIQKMFLDISINSYPDTLGKQLENNIIIGIIDLLIDFQKCHYIDNIDWLLIQTDSIWKEYFKKYAQQLFAKLEHQVSQHNDYFYNRLLEKLWEGAKYAESNGSYQGFILPEYRNIAMLFKQIGNYNLSALFYQLGYGSVPPHIYDKVEVEFIPTIREEKPSGLQKNMKNLQNFLPFPFNQ